MVEIEIRGRLTQEEFKNANSFFTEHGVLKEIQDREMILLQDTPGYDSDPTKREIDIRLRRTNGKTEIMIKRKMSDNNVARTENSFNLGEILLEDAKELVKHFGSKKGQWMHRRKSIYDYKKVEWSLVEAVPGIFYYEAEMVAEESDDLEKLRLDLIRIVQNEGYSVMDAEEYKLFIELLGQKVNKCITW